MEGLGPAPQPPDGLKPGAFSFLFEERIVGTFHRLIRGARRWLRPSHYVVSNNVAPLCAVPIHSPFFWSAVPAWGQVPRSDPTSRDGDTARSACDVRVGCLFYRRNYRVRMRGKMVS